MKLNLCVQVFKGCHSANILGTSDLDMKPYISAINRQWNKSFIRISNVMYSEAFGICILSGI